MHLADRSKPISASPVSCVPRHPWRRSGLNLPDNPCGFQKTCRMARKTEREKRNGQISDCLLLFPARHSFPAPKDHKGLSGPPVFQRQHPDGCCSFCWSMKNIWLVYLKKNRKAWCINRRKYIYLLLEGACIAKNKTPKEHRPKSERCMIFLQTAVPERTMLLSILQQTKF